LNGIFILFLNRHLLKKNTSEKLSSIWTLINIFYVNNYAKEQIKLLNTLAFSFFAYLIAHIYIKGMLEGHISITFEPSFVYTTNRSNVIEKNGTVSFSLKSGVNFINVLCTAFMHADPERLKR